MAKETILFQCRDFDLRLKKKLMNRKINTGAKNITSVTEEVIRLGLAVLGGKK